MNSTRPSKGRNSALAWLSLLRSNALAPTHDVDMFEIGLQRQREIERTAEVELG